MEEKGQNARADTPESSSTTGRHEITIILSGESAFLYGNLLSEGPEDCSEPTTSGGNYDWASREASDFRSLFRNRVVLADWVENSCILRTLGYSSCVKLVAYRENERVFHGRENATNDFFYCYASPFYDMYVRLPLTNFQMEVLRTLKVAPTQLHPNSWGYMQVFAVMCQALAIRPTVALFLRFFRCRPVAKKGWVSFISEPGDALLELYSQSYRGFKDKFFKVSILDSRRTYFFDEDGSPKFPLYWTQDPLRFTSWAEDKMTIGELEALSVLTALPRPFSSRRLINCLEHDDFDSRVFEIMGRKGSVRNWFQAIDTGKAGVGCPGPSSKPTQALPPPPSVQSASPDEVMVVEEQPLVRKRRGKAVDTTGDASKKMKETVEETDRPLPNDVWDPSFNLSHKIEFNLEYGLLVRLLIWEDHYYEPLPSPFPPRTIGVSNFPYRDGEGCWFSSESQLGIQEEDRVGGLINKMMLNNSVSIAGEGMVGRATFTGNYQWILMNNFSGDAYPPEVYSELHYQFSAGMQKKSTEMLTK
ncbi:hypothetical protein LR48_Vigan07g112800 [Vigna angularis]|uniref:Transposase (putative) gypsy type domain-containing protein n=1 Tax=Phaseolus angularis TaxID=3914 RepID=A0A0L9UXZ7_PHAAN|nr:hypothetical protein LR48_Vigan07g112800 [Vigna angularis]